MYLGCKGLFEYNVETVKNAIRHANENLLFTPDYAALDIWRFIDLGKLKLQMVVWF